MKAVLLLIATVTIAWNGSYSVSSQTRPGLTAACAAFDVHIFTEIEDAENANVSPEILQEAHGALDEARHACRHEEYDRALEIYSRIYVPSVAVSPLRSAGVPIMR
jgi:hypothetical protein